MTTVVIRTNLPDFKRQLEHIKLDLRTKVVRQALASGTQAFAKEARRLAPVLQPPKDGRRRINREAGVLKRAIFAAKTKKPTAPGVERYYVGVREGKKYQRVKVGKGKYGSRDAFYWRWQEAGWIPRGPGRKIRGGERRRKLERERIVAAGGRRVPGRDFLKRAFETQQQRAVAEFERRLGLAIVKYNGMR